MQQIDYGPASPELVAMMEKMRQTLPPERRLLMAKLLGRTVATDGDDAERTTGALVDQTVTAFFQNRDSE